MSRRFLVLLSFLVLTLTACALPTVPPNPYNPIYKVAVLPVYNATNDVDGPQMVRAIVEKRIQHLHYSSMPLAEVDTILRDQMGITLGSQLDMTTPQKLGEALGVDGVVYGYLLNFDQITTGAYNVKKVRAGFKIVDTKTGQAVWSRGQGVKAELTSGLLGQGLSAVSAVKDNKEGIDQLKGSIQGIETIPMISDWRKIESQQEQSAGNAAMFSLGEKLVGKALGIHMKHESEVMVNIIFQDFPIGPGGQYGVAVAAAPPAPDFEMPKVEMPSFGVPAYFALGDKDFTADMVMTSVNKKGSKGEDKFVMSAKLAKRGVKYRSDIDMSKTAKGSELPPGLGRMAFVELEKDKKYMLYPEKKKYFEANTRTEQEPRVEKVKVGEEVVGGYRCIKYKAKVTSANGVVQNGFLWEAKELSGFMIKAEFEDNDHSSTMEISNLKLVSPSPSLFEIPKDYVKSSMIEIMMDGK